MDPGDGQRGRHALDTGLSDDTTDTDTGEVADADPYADFDFSSWSGTRVFVADECGSDTLEESGQRVAPPLADELALACPDCDYFYRLDVTPNTICYGYFQISSTAYRGLALGDGWASLYSIAVEGDDIDVSLLDGSADLHDGSIAYDYQTQLELWWGQTVAFDVAGSVLFAEK